MDLRFQLSKHIPRSGGKMQKIVVGWVVVASRTFCMFCTVGLHGSIRPTPHQHLVQERWCEHLVQRQIFGPSTREPNDGHMPSTMDTCLWTHAYMVFGPSTRWHNISKLHQPHPRFAPIRPAKTRLKELKNVLWESVLGVHASPKHSMYGIYAYTLIPFQPPQCIYINMP